MSLRATSLGVALLLLAGAAAAQPRPVLRPPRTPPRLRPVKVKKPRVTKKTSNATSLESRLGLAVAARLLASKDADDRKRGLERLGAVGTPAALELLEKAIESGGPAKNAEERLVAVRALAPHAHKEDVRLSLVRAMGGSGTSPTEQRADPFVALSRSSAALALAKAGDRGALSLLGQALRQEGPIAEAAADALLAHPPRDIAPILEARGAPTVTLAEVLGALGDQRAFATLRSFVRRGAPEVKIASAIALTRLGDLETVALARHWLSVEKDPAFLVGAARILATTHAAGYDKAVAALLARDETRSQALDIALSSPSAQLASALSDGAKDDDRWVAALGRSDPGRLKALLGDPRQAAAAAYVLATAPGGVAESSLHAALTAPATRRLAARAAVVRAIALGDRISDLDAALTSLERSSAAADQSAAAWARTRLDPSRARRLLASKDVARVRGAARNAFLPEVAPWAAERLATERDPITRTALAGALAVPEARDRVPTRVLSDLVDAGGAAAPIAALALAARDDTSLRPKLLTLLEDDDPLLRAHVALGLGDSKDPTALGVLEARYRREPDARVRRALVVALSRRPEPVRQRALRLASDLDPDRDTRQAARRALSGRKLAPLTTGHESVWLVLTRSGGGEPGPVAARVVTASGVALPVVADSDGLLVVSGLGAGPTELSLAADANPDHAAPKQ